MHTLDFPLFLYSYCQSSTLFSSLWLHMRSKVQSSTLQLSCVNSSCCLFVLFFRPTLSIYCTVHNQANRPKNNRRWRNSFTRFVFIHCTIISSWQKSYERSLNAKIISYLGWWPSLRCAPTSLHSVPLLTTDCPVSHKPLVSLLPQAHFPFEPPNTHTCETVLLREGNICTSDVFFIRYMYVLFNTSRDTVLFKYWLEGCFTFL
jgi:hypothetical protein